MTLKLTGNVRLHLPAYPSSPTNGQVWVDPVTNTSWTYSSATGTWRLT
jgi:hypothetical protein